MEFRARLKQSLWNGRVEKNPKGVLEKLGSIAGLLGWVGRFRQQFLLRFIVLPTKNKHCSFPLL